MKEFWKQKLTSRKFWVAVATAIFIVLSEGLGFNVDEDLYWKLITIALGYIFGESAVDIARARVSHQEEIPVSIKELNKAIEEAGRIEPPA